MITQPLIVQAIDVSLLLKTPAARAALAVKGQRELYAYVEKVKEVDTAPGEVEATYIRRAAMLVCVSVYSHEKGRVSEADYQALADKLDRLYTEVPFVACLAQHATQLAGLHAAPYPPDPKLNPPQAWWGKMLLMAFVYVPLHLTRDVSVAWRYDVSETSKSEFIRRELREPAHG